MPGSAQRNHIEDGDVSASPAVCDRAQLGHAFAKACKWPRRAKVRNPALGQLAASRLKKVHFQRRWRRKS